MIAAGLVLGPVGAGVRRLTILAPPLAWGLGAVAAHYAGGLSWPVSWVLGAILVVTGPTVILPLLRQARLHKDIGSLLKWEGICNARLVEREQILDFKSSLTVVLLAGLFIVIPGQLTRADLASLDLRAVAFVAVILFLVRPLSIWIATIGLTLGPLARRLGLATSARNGLLIVGASPFAQALGEALAAADIDVLVTDGSYRRLSRLRKASVPTWSGEILSDHADEELEASHLNYVLAATDNGFYNALVCRSQNDSFGSTHVFQLPMQKPSGEDANRLPLQRRGHFAFDRVSDYYVLHGHIKDDWQVWTTPSRTSTVPMTSPCASARRGRTGCCWAPSRRQGRCACTPELIR